MNKVITASEVRTRLALTDDEGVNAAINSAIGAALVRTEAVLGTLLQVGTASDVFFIDPHVDVATRGTFVLKLSNGLAKQQGMVITYSGTLEGLSDSPDAVQAFVVQEERGFVFIPEALSGNFIRVVYSYGLAESDEAPSWLKEAVLCYTAKVLSSQQISDGKPELSNAFAFLDQHGSTIIDRHLRSNSDAILPLA